MTATPASRLSSWVLAAGLTASFLTGARPSGPALAATYYVDQGHPNASDSNPGTAEDSPWLTLARAMTVTAGDTVYVKNGIYKESNSVVYHRPAIRPRHGGTASAPVAFRAFPGHQPVVTVTVALGGGNDYVIWDGFTSSTGTTTVGSRYFVYGSKSDPVEGFILENCTIHGTPISTSSQKVPGDNYPGIFAQHTGNGTIRNCVIRDFAFTDSHGVNAAGILLYFNRNLLVEHNEIYRTNVAIFDKAAGEFNVFRNNYIHDVFNTGILFACFGHDQAPCRGSEIYQNVIANARKGGLAIGNDTVPHIPFHDFRVYNNTIHNVPIAISNGTTPGLRLWNNILSATESAMLLRNVPTDIALSDFSDFHPAARFASERTTYATLSMWQRGTGLDRHSIRQDPLFADPGAGDHRLRPDSPARGAGREGGVATGAPVDMGAYPMGAERIGPCGRECR